MVNNAGLDNEKSALTYQVELLKDQMEECEEQSALVTKELREKSRDFELLKRSHAETQRAVQLLQVCIRKFQNLKNHFVFQNWRNHQFWPNFEKSSFLAKI